MLKKQILFILLLITFSQNCLAAVYLNDWRYTGYGSTQYNAVMGVLDLADPAYDDSNFIHMATEYDNSPASVVFQVSTLTVDSSGNIIPDPITGYDGNIAVISADFSPSTWDGFAYLANEFGETCNTVIDLTSIPPVAPSSGKCKSPVNSSIGQSPNIRYGVIYLNTNGDSSMTPLQSKRRHLLVHEIGHVLGLGHSDSSHCNLYTSSTSVMVPDSDPSVCFGVPNTLQTVDESALSSKY